MGDAAVVERYIEHVTVNGGPAAPGEPGTFTADEALNLVREHDHDDCPLRAAYDAASEKGQRQLRDAAEQLVVELGDECPQAAVMVLQWRLWWFPERDRLDRLVTHYLEYGPFEQLGAVLRSQAGGLQRTHVQQLDAVVAADPLRHQHVCVAILKSPHDEGSTAWKALKDRARQSTDPAELASIHDVAVQAGVHADFYEILGSRALSRKVLEATADRIKRDAFLFRSSFTD
jgi:hypothetical protein